MNLKTLLKMTCQSEKDKQCLALLLEEHTITKPTEAQPGKGKMGILNGHWICFCKMKSSTNWLHSNVNGISYYILKHCYDHKFCIIYFNNNEKEIYHLADCLFPPSCLPPSPSYKKLSFRTAEASSLSIHYHHEWRSFLCFIVLTSLQWRSSHRVLSNSCDTHLNRPSHSQMNDIISREHIMCVSKIQFCVYDDVFLDKCRRHLWA